MARSIFSILSGIVFAYHFCYPCDRFAVTWFTVTKSFEGRGQFFKNKPHRLYGMSYKTCLPKERLLVRSHRGNSFKSYFSEISILVFNFLHNSSETLCIAHSILHSFSPNLFSVFHSLFIYICQIFANPLYQSPASNSY